MAFVGAALALVYVDVINPRNASTRLISFGTSECPTWSGRRMDVSRVAGWCCQIAIL